MAYCRCGKKLLRGHRCKGCLHKIEGLEVKKSNIEGAGLGLFATKEIPKNRTISEYTGTYKPNFYKGNRKYAIYNSVFDCILDADKGYHGAARYANDARGTGKQNNAALVEDPKGKICLISKKKILPGSEILTSYGNHYWNT